MDKSFSFLKNKVIPLHNENTFLRPLAADKIPPEYVRWMGDSEVIRFTEQRFQIASEKSIKDYVSQMNNSDNNLFYGVFFGNKITNADWCRHKYTYWGDLFIYGVI